MKKVLSIFIVLTMVILNCMVIFGEDITSVNITYAKQQDDKSILVKGNVSKPIDGQILTIMSTEYSKETGYNIDSIVYIDQLESKVDTNGDFNISFFMSDNVKEDSLYCVRIGGSNITTPSLLLIINDAAVPLGDADGNGTIDAHDAVLVLENVLKMETHTLNSKAHVTTNDELSAEDSANILKKVLDPNYIFPIEAAQ